MSGVPDLVFHNEELVQASRVFLIRRVEEIVRDHGGIASVCSIVDELRNSPAGRPLFEASDDDAATSLRSQLSHHPELRFTSNGLWVSQAWFHTASDDDDCDGSTDVAS